jgi:putative membrane protein
LSAIGQNDTICQLIWPTADSRKPTAKKMIDYDPHDWRSHLFDIKGSMVRQIIGRVLTVMAWGVAVVCFYEWVYWTWDVKIGVPITAHALIGVALGLLLVFRTNSSYDRFWEGRKLWGGIVNETRNLARAAAAVLPDSPDLVRRIILWTISFPHAAMHRLRGGVGIGPPANELPQDQVAATLKENHIPLAVARRISEELNVARQQGLISDIQQMALDQNVQQLIDYIGACERIRKTPMPFSYMVHLRRAIILYCFTLPFALVIDYGWWTIIVVLLVAYTFYGIEEIGVEIEDPFGRDDNDLPLERFCATIEENLRGLIPHHAGAVSDGVTSRVQHCE